MLQEQAQQMQGLSAQAGTTPTCCSRKASGHTINAQTRTAAQIDLDSSYSISTSQQTLHATTHQNKLILSLLGIRQTCKYSTRSKLIQTMRSMHNENRLLDDRPRLSLRHARSRFDPKVQENIKRATELKSFLQFKTRAEKTRAGFW